MQDTTGVKVRPSSGARYSAWSFGADRRTPTRKMCGVWRAWGLLLDVASALSPLCPPAQPCPPPAPLPEPLAYDLVDTGREVLAQLTSPLAANFSEAVFGGATPLDARAVAAAGGAYAAVLTDLDALVGTDQAFLLGSWLAMARRLAAAANGTDCVGEAAPGVPVEVKDCEHFYEWNARAQLTTWNPTPKGAVKVPGGPLDYAGKHWNGLIKDYYAVRITKLTEIARANAAAGKPLDVPAAERLQAQLAFDFQVDTTRYATTPVGDPAATSAALRAKYAPAFAACA